MIGTYSKTSVVRNTKKHSNPLRNIERSAKWNNRLKKMKNQLKSINSLSNNSSKNSNSHENRCRIKKNLSWLLQKKAKKYRLHFSPQSSTSKSNKNNHLHLNPAPNVLPNHLLLKREILQNTRSTLTPQILRRKSHLTKKYSCNLSVQKQSRTLIHSFTSGSLNP